MKSISLQKLAEHLDYMVDLELGGASHTWRLFLLKNKLTEPVLYVLDDISSFYLSELIDFLLVNDKGNSNCFVLYGYRDGVLKYRSEYFGEYISDHIEEGGKTLFEDPFNTSKPNIDITCNTPLNNKLE